MGGAGNDTLNSGPDGDDTLMGGAGNDVLTAVNGVNTLMGGAGDDDITGGSGADTINGGAGDDQMTGGGGNDIFVFSPDDGDGDDVITTFSATDDAINLSAYLISDPDDFLDNVDVFGGSVRVDLTEYGGGKIILSGVTAGSSRDRMMGANAEVFTALLIAETDFGEDGTLDLMMVFSSSD